MATKKELIKEFGIEIIKIPGLVKKLLEDASNDYDSGFAQGSTKLEDVKVKEGVAAWLLDKHYWERLVDGFSGIEMYSRIKVCREEKVYFEDFHYRNMKNPERDYSPNHFTGLEILKVTPREVKIRVTRFHEGFPKEILTFETAKDKIELKQAGRHHKGGGNI